MIIRAKQLIEEGKIFPQENGKCDVVCVCGRMKRLCSVGKARISYLTNRECHTCNRTGERNPNFGKPSPNKGNVYSDELKNHLSKKQLEWIAKSGCQSKGVKKTLDMKQKLSAISKKQFASKENRKKHSEIMKQTLSKPEVRKNLLNAIIKSGWIKVRTDNGCLELLEKWNRLGFSFEANYQINTDKGLFYIDGYDKDKNVVFEYDTKYHDSLYQKKKDLLRQQRIIDILKPKIFWRYSVTNEKFVNVISGGELTIVNKGKLIL